MIHHCALTVFFFLITVSAQGQPDSTVAKQLCDSARYYSFEDFDKTVYFANEAQARLTPAQSSTLTEELYLIRFTTARFFFRYDQCRAFIKQYQDFVKASEQLLGNDYTRQLEESRIWLAEYYHDTGNFQAALNQFTSSLAVLNTLPSSERLAYTKVRVMLAMATILSARGEYEAAVNQFLATRTIYAEIDSSTTTTAGTRHYRDMLLYRNISQVLVNKQDFVRAKQYLDIAISHFNSLNPEDLALYGSTVPITTFETLAAYYRGVLKYDSALIVLKQTLPLLKHTEPFRARVYKGLGDVHAAVQEFKIARQYYQDAIALKLKDSGPKGVQLADMWIAMGALHERTGRHDEALDYYQKAINSLITSRADNDPSHPELRNILLRKSLFTALQQQSHVHFKKYLVDRNNESLSNAWKLSQLSIALLDSAMNDVSLQKDKVIVAGQCFSAYENAIRIANECYQRSKDEKYLDQMFAFTDKSKGVVLLENLRLVNNFAGVDPQWSEQERALYSEVSLTEQAIYNLQIDPTRDASRLDQLRAQFATRKHEYADLLSKIRTQAPDYYKLRFDHSVVSPNTIQKELLASDEGLITFFLGDSTLTVFGFSQSDSHVQHFALPDDLHDLIDESRSALLDPESDTNADTRCRKLYELLLADCLKKLGSNVRSLIIIPDGILGYIPFEILPSPAGSKYLIDDYRIRYAHSATYLHEQNRRLSGKAKRFFGGFVSSGETPTASTSRADGKLLYAREEVEAIAGMIEQAVIYSPALKSDFTREAGNYRILHLAMHSVLNDEDPMRSTMVFARNANDSTIGHELTALELYNLRLEADLAVLSACNTGSGELHRGEGIMSFSRAFAYAGVPSAIISLWQVPDKATSKIMQGFYGHLKEGRTKSQALQLAKRDFVEKYPAMKHPYYWSGFILAGNDAPIPFPMPRYWWWTITGFVAIVLMFGFGVLRRRRPSESVAS